MIERAALARVKRKVTELGALLDELRQALEEYEQLAGRIDSVVAEGNVLVAESEELTALTDRPKPAGEHDLADLRRTYQALLHPDVLSLHDLTDDGDDLSVRLNSAIDSGDALAAADVLNRLVESLDGRSDLPSMVIRMFALEDQVRLLQAVVHEHADSPLGDIRDALAADPDLDLGAFLT